MSRTSRPAQTAGVAFAVTITARNANGELASGFAGAVDLGELTSLGAGRISPTQRDHDVGPVERKRHRLSRRRDRSRAAATPS